MLASSSTSFTAQWLTEALGGRWNGRTGTARCPAHPDRTPSLSITSGTKQDVVVHCFVCDQSDVVAKIQEMGLWPRDNTPWSPPVLHINNTMDMDDSDDLVFPASAPTPIRKHIATYPYVDENGVLLYEKLRYSPKDFDQRTPSGKRSLEGVRRVLYRLPELLAAPEAPVWLCEGEKDADTLTALGLIATSTVEGAKLTWGDTTIERWQEYAAFLRGRDVILLPDNDDVGRAQMNQAQAALRSHAARVRIVTLDGLEEHGDVTDWLEAGHTLQDLLRVAETIASRFKLLTPDELETLPSPEYLASGWLVRGTLSCVYGPAGVGKSFVELDLVFSIASGTEWLGCVPVTQGIVVYVAAEGVGGLKGRLQAWRAKHPGVDISNVRFLPVAVNLLEMHEIDDFIESIKAQCDGSPVLVIFDTLARSMPGGDENSAKDMNVVIAAADRVRITFGCHVQIVHHTGRDGDHERGSTALRGAVDTSIYVLKNENGGGIIVRCIKAKDDPEPEELTVKLVPVDGTPSCVLELTDTTGEVSESAKKVLVILADHFPLTEGASTTAWLKASGMTERTFYRARTILIQNKFVAKDGKMAPNRLTTWGCRDIDIDPDGAVSVVTATTAKVLPWQ